MQARTTTGAAAAHGASLATGPLASSRLRYFCSAVGFEAVSNPLRACADCFVLLPFAHCARACGLFACAAPPSTPSTPSPSPLSPP